MSQQRRRLGRLGQMTLGIASMALLAVSSGTPVMAEPPPAALPAEPAVRAADEARAVLMAANLYERWSMPDDAAERARMAGVDEARVLRWLEVILADCLAQDGRCADPLQQPEPRRDLVEVLLNVLGEVGSEKALPVLQRLDARGLYPADTARARIHERAMLQAVGQHPCAPPSAAEIARVRAALADFAVVRARAGRLVAEPPAAGELDDLSYFLAAVSEAGMEVGRLPAHARASWSQPAPASRERDQLAAEIEAAELRGDIAAVARHAQAYLATLGHPGAAHFEDESAYGWGGARYSYVMRDLAEAAEDLGDLGRAAEMYRAADPGGGACGTSTDARWQDQVQGLIRAEERRGRCRAVVAERLLGIDEGFEPDVYGTTRLRAAGFDVPRLYRGALVTRNREIEPAELEGVLAQTPDALARLRTRGPEDWSRRVHAVRGLAQAGQQAALPALLEIAASSAPDVAIESLQAIADLAEKPSHDPCELTGGSFSFSTAWERPIQPLHHACETHLRPPARARLAAALRPLLRHAAPEVREAARLARRRILHGSDE
jgi:hypothetical protein